MIESVMNHMLNLNCKQSACLKTLRLMSEYICPLRQAAKDLQERFYLDNKEAAHFESSVMNRSMYFHSVTQTCYSFEMKKLSAHIM